MAEAGFLIDGKEYPIPVVVTFDMDEAEILWNYCGYGLEDLVPDADGTWSDERNAELLRSLKNPAFRKTLLHVAYRRGNPDASAKEIQKRIGKVSNLEALAAWMGQFGDDAGPPAQESTSTPGPSSSSELVDSNTSSGNGSSTTSTEPGSLPEPIGATR